MAEYIKWFVGPQFNKRNFIKLLRYRMNVPAAEVEDGIILDKDAFNLMPSAIMPHWAFINKEDINSPLHTRMANFNEYKEAMKNDSIAEEYIFEEEQKYVQTNLYRRSGEKTQRDGIFLPQ